MTGSGPEVRFSEITRGKGHGLLIVLSLTYVTDADSIFAWRLELAVAAEAARPHTCAVLSLG
jgi:hypothetical protein